MLYTALISIESYLALFFAICIILKKNKYISDYYLTIWVLVLSAFLLCKLFDSPFFIASESLLSAFHGIILFLYFKNITINSPFKPKDLLFFIPYLVVVSPVFFVDGYLFSTAYQVLKQLLILTYVALSIILVKKYKHSVKESFSNVEYIDVTWLNILIFWSVLYSIIPAIKLLYVDFPAGNIEIIVFFLFMNFCGLREGIHALFFRKLPPKIDNAPDHKLAYSNYGLRSSDAVKLSEKLSEYMEREKPYLNPTLSLRDLATAMDTYSHYITQVLNTVFNQKFYDFVNRYRVEEAERQLIDPLKANFTILAIAYDCGFNSKATFNRVFKEKNGITPTEYKVAVKQQVESRT